MADGKFTDEHQMARCESMARLQSVIGGKWKILILWYVAAYEVQRFGELMRRLDGYRSQLSQNSCASLRLTVSSTERFTRRFRRRLNIRWQKRVAGSFRY